MSVKLHRIIDVPPPMTTRDGRVIRLTDGDGLIEALKNLKLHEVLVWKPGDKSIFEHKYGNHTECSVVTRVARFSGRNVFNRRFRSIVEPPRGTPEFLFILRTL